MPSSDKLAYKYRPRPRCQKFTTVDPSLTLKLISVFVIGSFTLFSVIQNCHALESLETSADDGTKPDTKPTLDPAPDHVANTDDSSTDTEPALTEERILGVQETLRDDTSFEKLYTEGVKAYDNQLWYSCASKIERAIKGYKYYRQTLSDCRLDCKKDPNMSRLYNLTSNVASFEVFGFFLKTADCFRRCVDEIFGEEFEPVPEKLQKEFEKRIPYQYLQFCYFKLEEPSKAAAAAYTFFLRNSEDDDNKKNVIYYRDRARVPDSHFVDLEMVTYKEHYIRAMVAYNEEEWVNVVTHLEQSLEEYFNEHEHCLVDCEAYTAMERSSEFTTTVADWMNRILICKIDCEDKLSTVYNEPIPFFLQNMYHYLQFAYFQVKNLEKCVEVTATFLAMNSSHKVMKDNKEVLKTQNKFTENDFKPRQEVVDYMAVRNEMMDLMDTINKNYRWPFKAEIPEEEEPDLHTALYNLNKQLADKDDWISRYEQLGMHNIARSTDLLQVERFVTDGLLKPEQCDELLTLTQDLKKKAYGSQIFDLKIAQQKLEEDPDEEYEVSLRLYVRSAEVVRHYTQHYLNPDLPYYLKKTSIVCWSPLEDPTKELPCYPQEDGTCLKFHEMSDELYEDLYTTVTYLNAADEDGDFLYLNEDNRLDRSFGVKCGRTIGFNTGDRHALRVPKGNSPRCALVLKYSTDKSEDEKEYQDTISLLHHVDKMRMASASQKPEVVLKKFADEGVKVVKEAKDLKAKERFVADGVASDAQCSTLRNMVLSGALVGDGYEHLKTKPSEISPHTEHEMFKGITIYRASRLAHENLISTVALRAFLELSENSRLFVEKYFNLSRPIYFDFTHLVCRTAVDDSKWDREDLSHPVHADNCILQPDGTCTKDFPAFIQRDYSAILYLNNDFEGGEFFFAHSNKSEQVSVRPTCGRLVGFNAGHFHGVRAVKSGQRCALALWFTYNANFKELAHVQARKFLKDKEEQQKHQEARAAREDL